MSVAAPDLRAVLPAILSFATSASLLCISDPCLQAPQAPIVGVPAIVPAGRGKK